MKAELKRLRGGKSGDLLTAAKIDEISERLRLLYVAVTRARENLLISWHKKDNFNRKTGPALPLIELKKVIAREQEKHAGEKH